MIHFLSQNLKFSSCWFFISFIMLVSMRKIFIYSCKDYFKLNGSVSGYRKDTEKTEIVLKIQVIELIQSLKVIKISIYFVKISAFVLRFDYKILILVFKNLKQILGKCVCVEYVIFPASLTRGVTSLYVCVMIIKINTDDDFQHFSSIFII